MSIQPETRIDWANTHNNEKEGAQAVRKYWLQCRAIGELKLNGEQLPKLPKGSAGLLLDWREIHSIEHPVVVMVENLSVMAALEQIHWPQSLQHALFVFRGDARDVQTSSAYHFCRQLKCPVVAFADFDPKGVEIALTCGAAMALLPKRELWDQICHPDWQSLIGPEVRWQSQEQSRQALADRAHKPEWVDEALRVMGKHGRTRTQEHLIAHQVPLELLPL